MRYRTVCRTCGAKTMTFASEWKKGRIRPKCSRCGATLQSRGPKIRRSKQNKADAAKTTKPKKPMKPSVVVALEGLDEVRDRARGEGIKIETKVIRNTRGRRDSVHVMFNTGKWRLLDYWPGTGTVTVGGTNGRKTKVQSLDDALNIAIQAKGIG